MLGLWASTRGQARWLPAQSVSCQEAASLHLSVLLPPPLCLPGSQSLMEPLGGQREGPRRPPRHGRWKTPGDLAQGRFAVNQDSRPGPSLRSHQGTIYPTSGFFPLAKRGPWNNQPAPVCMEWQRTDVLWSPLDKEAGRKEGHLGPAGVEPACVI